MTGLLMYILDLFESDIFTPHFKGFCPKSEGYKAIQNLTGPNHLKFR